MAVPHDPDPSACAAVIAGPDSLAQSARDLLVRHGDPTPELRFALLSADRAADALATCLMDLYRRTRDGDAFECLVALTREGLLRRVRIRLRYLGAALDPDEVLQDVLVNVYRYPDRFDASRAGAFRAWSTTIVDNSIRRQLRRRQSGPELVLQPAEDLSRQRDRRSADPSDSAAEGEARRQAAHALQLLLRAYLVAYQELNERERFVLQMVEVRGLRYAQIAEALDVRPEALKMVVFRARRRIYDKLTVMFARAGAGAAQEDAAA